MRAQGSAEFLIVLSCVVIVVLILTMIYSGQVTNFFQSKNVLSAKKTAYEVTSIINNVYLVGNGTQYTIWIDSNNGTITISGNNVVVEKNKVKVYASLLTKNINTTFITTGYKKIKNNNGLIEID